MQTRVEIHTTTEDLRAYWITMKHIDRGVWNRVNHLRVKRGLVGYPQPTIVLIASNDWFAHGRIVNSSQYLASNLLTNEKAGERKRNRLNVGFRSGLIPRHSPCSLVETIPFTCLWTASQITNQQERLIKRTRWLAKWLQSLISSIIGLRQTPLYRCV